MKPEEFNKLFEGITNDNFYEKVLDIKDTLAKENVVLETSFDTIKQKEQEINMLRDTNQKLFLRVSQNVNEDIATHTVQEDLTLDNLIAKFN